MVLTGIPGVNSAGTAAWQSAAAKQLRKTTLSVTEQFCALHQEHVIKDTLQTRSDQDGTLNSQSLKQLARLQIKRSEGTFKVIRCLGLDDQVLFF